MTIFSQLILFLGIPFCYLRKTRGPKTGCKCDVTVTCRHSINLRILFWFSVPLFISGLAESRQIIPDTSNNVAPF